MDITIELTDNTDGYFEASCPEFGLVARAASLEEVLGRVSRLIVYAASSLEEMPLSVADWQEGIGGLGASVAEKNFCMPRYPKIH